MKDIRTYEILRRKKNPKDIISNRYSLVFEDRINHYIETFREMRPTSASVQCPRVVLSVRAGTISLKGGKTRRKKLVSGITKHLSAEHDFFGADTRLGVYRARTLARSPRHYVKLNKHKSLNKRANGERNASHVASRRGIIAPSKKPRVNKF